MKTNNKRHLSRVIREVLFDRKALIDILTLKTDRQLALPDEPLQEDIILTGQYCSETINPTGHSKTYQGNAFQT